MDSCKLVRDTIFHRNTTNIRPFAFRSSYFAHLEYKNPALFAETSDLLASVPEDTWWMHAAYSSVPTLPDFVPPESPIPDTTVDEWGTTWRRFHQMDFPLKDLGSLSHYEFPRVEPGDGRFEQYAEQFKEWKDQYKIWFFGFVLFEKYTSLRGFENHLMDPYLNSSEHQQILDGIMAVNMAGLEQAVKCDFDAVCFGDDLGTQESLLLDPDVWRDRYKPRMKQMFDFTHKHDMDVWLHSDGNINEILPDLIEIGLDVVNPVQPQLFDIPALGQEYGGKLAFLGGIDVQYYLPCGTPEEIAEQYRLYDECLGGNNGGFIPCATNAILDDVPLENIMAITEILVARRQGTWTA